MGWTHFGSTRGTPCSTAATVAPGHGPGSSCSSCRGHGLKIGQSGSPGTWSSLLCFIDGLEGLGVTPLGGVTAMAPSIPSNGRIEETPDRGAAVAIKARRAPGAFVHLLPQSNSRPPHKLPAPMARARRGVGHPRSSSAAAESGPSTRGRAVPRGRGIRGRGGRSTAAPLLGAWFIPALHRSSSSWI